MYIVSAWYMFDFIIARDSSELCNWQLEIQAGSSAKGLEVNICKSLCQGGSV